MRSNLAKFPVNAYGGHGEAAVARLLRTQVSQRRSVLHSIEPVERSSTRVSNRKNEDMLAEALVRDRVEPEAAQQVPSDRWFETFSTRPRWPNMSAFAHRVQRSVDLRQEVVAQSCSSLIVPVGSFEDLGLCVRMYDELHGAFRVR